jgi:2,4-dienoyl-CoA reductase-like NADH-dependent reductase (Old Yellow Enzyme family)/ribulose 1,5-bisphosphate synthetase/thiazole synthase
MTQAAPLFTPLRIGPMQVANRMMMSGMSAGSSVDADGEITDEMVAYYVERARTCPGMIAIGAAAAVPPEEPLPRGRRTGSAGLRLYADDMIPSLRRLVDAVHQYDTRFGIQLFNAGGTGKKSALISPSGISSNVRDAREPGRAGGQRNRPLLTEEIPRIVGCYAAAADRCRQAGFDFVEIHGGHGYLISNFLTPLFNRRTDRYGGSFDNRVRFILEITEAVKKRVGGSVAVGVKFNGDDFIGEDGWTIADSVRLAPLVEAAGADYITVTAGLIGADRLTIPPMYEPQGCYVDMAAAVKEVVRVPVGTVGRIKDPAMASGIVTSGRADLVVMGRAFIADPEFVAKVREDRVEDIRPCLADCRGCADEHIQRGGHTSCVVNPRMCRELDLVDVKGSAKANPKRVLVVGGGLAGLEAARRCAYSGHHVTLSESRDHLGGQICLAARMAGRQELGDILPWYERQMAKLEVTVRLNTVVDEKYLKEEAPDVVIAATGSVPQVPGNMMSLVAGLESVQIVMLDDVIEGREHAGAKVLVIGGDQNGAVAADWLAAAGREVWIAEPSAHFAQKLAAHDRWYLFTRMADKRVERVKNVMAIEADGHERITLVTPEGRRTLPAIDTIVFASERKANRAIAEIAGRMGLETHVVGDAHDVSAEHGGTIFANIARAYDVARRI